RRWPVVSRSRASTIGRNPRAALLPPPVARAAAGGGEASTPLPTSTRQGSERFTVHLPVTLVDRLRDAVYWTPGLTLSRMAETAFDAALRDLEAERGTPYPPRRGELRAGRPIA